MSEEELARFRETWGELRAELRRRAEAAMPGLRRFYAAVEPVLWEMNAPALYAEAIGEGDEEQYEVFV